MSSIRSSVRPESSKLPWGTILKPEFGLGYQKMTEYEIEQTVTRLNQIPEARTRTYEKPTIGRPMSDDEINAMVSKVTYKES